MDPATISMLASLGGKGIPMLMSMFSDPESDQERIQRIIEFLRGNTQNVRASAIQSAQAGAQNVEQNFNAVLGQTGLGQTGVGGVARGLGASLSGFATTKAIGDYESDLMNSALRGAESGMFDEPSRYDRFMGSIAGMMANGQNPFQDAIQATLGHFNQQNSNVVGVKATPGMAMGGAHKPGSGRTVERDRRAIGLRRKSFYSEPDAYGNRYAEGP